MSGLAVAIDWSEASDTHRNVVAMLGAMPHRGLDGSSVATHGIASLGFAMRATTRRQRSIAQPFRDPTRTVSIVGDVRIDNRDEIVRTLGIAPLASDIELLSRAFARWGTALAVRLVGDFAFAVWNARSRTLYAARDAFGVRPLFFSHAGSRFELASEVDALLAVDHASDTVDLVHLAEYAGGSIRDAERTMYASIRRLPPGHELIARDGHVITRRWYRYPRADAPRDGAEDVAAVRAALLQSVEDRLDGEHAIYCQLSGGLDSSAVACAAGVIQRRNTAAAAPAVVLASATYPGLRCDESDEIDAVLARLPFEHVRWRFDDPSLTTLDPIARSTPWRDPQPGSALHSLDIARANGSRVVLTGHGGDELFHEHGVFTDLARRGRLVALYRETIGSDLYLANPGSHYFEQALRAAVPSPIRRLRRMLRGRVPVSAPPQWFGRRLAEAWHSRRPATREHVAPHHVGALTWDWVTSPTGAVFRDIDELAAARRSVELRHPLFDQRLAAIVLSIPWQRRLVGGRMKALLRDAMADELPPIIRQRRRVTTFEQAVVAAVRSQMGLLEATVNSPWASSEIVDRSVARELLARVDRAGGSATYEDCYDLWSAASIELWIRTKQKRYGES